MPERILLDNDVVMKVAAYTLGEETIAVTTIDDVPPAMLGVGRFVIRSRLSRPSSAAEPARALAAFERMLEGLGLVEPDDDELAAAADLEAEAIRRDLELDGGESQLLAILVSRRCDLMITGDKRAIAAMASVAIAQAAERIACLEQLISQILTLCGADSVQPRVCAEPNVDRAITSSFACSSRIVPEAADLLVGLKSYIADLDRSAPGVLIRGHDLSSVAA